MPRTKVEPTYDPINGIMILSNMLTDELVRIGFIVESDSFFHAVFVHPMAIRCWANANTNYSSFLKREGAEKYLWSKARQFTAIHPRTRVDIINSFDELPLLSSCDIKPSV